MALIGRDPTNFGEHSGRRGGATAASEAGVSWIDLKRHGRWASNSAPQRYIEDTQKRTNKVPNILLQSAKDNNNNARTRRNESPPRRNILVQSIKDNNNNARTRPDESPPRKSARRALYQEDKKSDRSEGITNAAKQCEDRHRQFNVAGVLLPTRVQHGSSRSTSNRSVRPI